MSTYLGDGVYVKTDGYHVTLVANGNIIHLVPHVRCLLYEILKKEIEPEEPNENNDND